MRLFQESAEPSESSVLGVVLTAAVEFVSVGCMDGWPGWECGNHYDDKPHAAPYQLKDSLWLVSKTTELTPIVATFSFAMSGLWLYIR